MNLPSVSDDEQLYLLAGKILIYYAETETVSVLECLIFPYLFRFCIVLHWSNKTEYCLSNMVDFPCALCRSDHFVNICLYLFEQVESSNYFIAFFVF